MIAYDQLEAAGNPIIPPQAPFSGERFEAFKELSKQAGAHGSFIVCQLNHPGRQTGDRLQPNPVSASDVQLEGEVIGMTYARPHPATEKEIKEIIESFTHAAEYLYKAGYDGIALHAAHGYLLAQFLSQTTNKRTDQYGGSLANRARLTLEIAQSIREKVPSSTGFMISIKINSVEFQAEGFSPDEAQEFCSLLDDAEFDFVELSGGTYQESAFLHKRESSKKREAFFLEFADKIVTGLLNTRSYVTGGFRTVRGMVGALKTVDGVGLGRALCQEPHFCQDVLDGKITGAIDVRLDQQNFGLTNIVAGSQIRQIGKDQAPIDLSQQDNVYALMKDMGAWFGALKSDQEGKMSGYMDITSVPAKPYSTVME